MMSEKKVSVEVDKRDERKIFSKFCGNSSFFTAN
jgi:hypothetical protein